jgi:hypothetical protein
LIICFFFLDFLGGQVPSHAINLHQHFQLSSAETENLNSGMMVVRQANSAHGGGGSATALQTIKAPPNVVWGQLLDFPSYVGKVDKLHHVSTPSNQRMHFFSICAITFASFFS